MSLIKNNGQPTFGHKIAGPVALRIADELEQGTVAVVEAGNIDAALDLATLATDLLRVFLKTRSMYKTTMFGLPGQCYRSSIRYLTADGDKGPGFRNRGEMLGCTFDDRSRAAWLASPAFTSLAALVGADHPLEEGHRRALLGVQFLSQAVLEHRPAFKILGLVIALESMLLERSRETQTHRLLRRAAYFTCREHADSLLCGRGRPACQYLNIDPGTRTGRQQLMNLRRLSEIDPLLWSCREWHGYENWYNLRSSVAHGDDSTITEQDASKAEYRILRMTADPLLMWLIEHPATPLTDLDTALANLQPVPEWQNPVPNPDAYDPNDYPLG